MHDLALHHTEEDQDHPQQDAHPPAPVGLRSIAFRLAEQDRQHEQRRRKTTEQHHHKMVSEESAMSGIFCTEQADIIVDELRDEPGAVQYCLCAIPESGNQ